MTERKDYENSKLIICLLLLVCTIHLFIKVRKIPDNYTYNTPKYYVRPESIEKKIDNSPTKILIEYKPIPQQPKKIPQIDNLSSSPPRQIKNNSNIQKYHKR